MIKCQSCGVNSFNAGWLYLLITTCQFWRKCFYSNHLEYILKAVNNMLVSILGQHSDARQVLRLGLNLAFLRHSFNKESEATSLIHQQMERSCLPAIRWEVCVVPSDKSASVSLQTHIPTDLMRDHLVYSICDQPSDHLLDREKRRWI